jgi:hypothetical protein
VNGHATVSRENRASGDFDERVWPNALAAAVAVGHTYEKRPAAIERPMTPARELPLAVQVPTDDAVIRSA